MRLTQDAARALMLATQGLLAPPRRRAAKGDVLATIRRMGALQIDTIQVVARSPYLVLWSRLGAYQTRWLDELLAEGALFEYWSHEACFLPIEDYPLYRRLMLDRLGRTWWDVNSWIEAHQGDVDRVLERIRTGGEARSSDFERTDGKKGSWWDWKVEKQALEMLYTLGDLMIARRENFQRIYDLRERVLPTWDDARTPSLDEARRALALHTVRALGVTPPRWLADYFRLRRINSARMLEQLAAEGELLPAEVEGWKEPAYIHPENRVLAEQAASGALRPTLTTLLSPFDPLVWDRRRALELFGFDYRIECYTPAPKRRYGYFTLPILRRGQLIGRLDPKAHRKERVFEVKALYLEPGVRVTAGLARDLGAALRACAAWHGTPQVVVRSADPPALIEALSTSAAQPAEER
jgi:uncharacterized protein